MAGTTRTDNARIESINITSTIRAKGSYAEVVFHSSTPATWRPRAGNEIIISTTSDALRHFGGIIERVVERPSNRLVFQYACDCKDYTWLFDRRMVATTYGASSAGAVLADIVTTYTTGFSTAGIDNLGQIAAQRFDYVYPSEAFNAIAAQQQAHWYVDFSKTVQYFSAITDVAPTTEINFDSSTGFSDMALEEDASNVRNRVIAQGYKRASTVQFNRTFLGDSTTRFFYLGYEPSGVASGDISVTVNGNTVDVLTDIVDGAPTEATGSSSQCFICFGNIGIRFSTGASAPSSAVSVTFNYMLDGGIQYDDPASQTEMASRSSGDGVHMFLLNDPGLTNRAQNDDLANYAAQAIAKRYGIPTISGKFKTYTQGDWRGGQYLTCASTYRMGGFNKTFYVIDVTKRIISHPSGGSPTWEYMVGIADNDGVV